jgi:hypothetical protein
LLIFADLNVVRLGEQVHVVGAQILGQNLDRKSAFLFHQRAVDTDATIPYHSAAIQILQGTWRVAGGSG